VSGLAWRLTLAAGWGRAALLAGCTAVVSGLLLVVVAVLSLPAQPSEPLYAVVAETGTRYGYVLGIVLLALPPLLLLHQAVRLGTAARERRLASLRLAGATPGDVRRIGAVEVGLPAFAGAVAGLGVYWLMRLLLGGNLSYTQVEGPRRHRSEVEYALRLVPTSVTPSWWQVLAVVMVVTLLGVAVGRLAGRHVVVTPLGVVRRAAPRPPRPWGLLAMLVAVVVLFSGAVEAPRMQGAEELLVFGGLLLLVLGLVALAPWAAYRVGSFVAGRARTAAVVLAARRLATEPRAAGRAASAVGGIGLAAGAAVAVVADLRSSGNTDAYYYIAVALVGAVLPLALVAVVGSLAVHSVESLLERKRSVAALVALGAPRDLLMGAMRWEAGLVAIPMAVGGALLGALGLGALVGEAEPWLLLATLAVVLLLAGLVWLAVLLMSWLVRPWVLGAADPGNLRTG
jgi:cell division protein FtsX